MGGSQPTELLPARLAPLSLGSHGESATVTVTETGRQLLPTREGSVVERGDRAILNELKRRKEWEESEMMTLGILALDGVSKLQTG